MTNETKTEDAGETGKKAGSGTPPGPAKGGLGFGIWLTVIVLIALGVGYLSWPVWKDRAETVLRENAPAVADLLPAVPAPAPEPVPTLAPQPEPMPAPEPTPAPEPAVPAPAAPDFSDRLNAIERTLAGLETRLAAGGSGEVDLGPVLDELARLRQRVDAIEARTPDASAERGVELLLLGRVQTAVLGGTPYADALDALERGLRDDATLLALAQPLRSGAVGGVKTRAALKSGFADVAGAVSSAIRTTDLTAPTDDRTPVPGWLARVFEKLSSLIVVRRVGAPDDASGPAADLARAEAALDADDMEGALGALGALDGRARTEAAVWMADARTHLDALAALAALQTEMLARATAE